MNVFGIIGHLGVIMDAVKSVEKLVEEVVTTKAPPSSQSIKLVLSSVANLFDSGVIDIPGVEEHDIAAALKTIESHIGV